MAAVAMLLLVAMGAMVAATMVTMPMEEVATVATSVAMVVLPKATTAMVAMEALLLVVSSLQCQSLDKWCCVHGGATAGAAVSETAGTVSHTMLVVMLGLKNSMSDRHSRAYFTVSCGRHKLSL